MNIYSNFIQKAKNGRQSSCPSAGEGLTKLWLIHSIEYCSGVNTDMCKNLHESPENCAE